MKSMCRPGLWRMFILPVMLFIAPAFSFAIESGQYDSGSLDTNSPVDAYVFEAVSNDTVIVRVSDEDSEYAFIPDLRVYYVITVPTPSTNVLVASATSTNDVGTHDLVYSVPSNGWYRIDCSLPPPLFAITNVSLAYSVSILLMPRPPLSYGDTDVGTILSGEALEGTIAVGADLDAAMFAVTSTSTVLLRLGQKDVALVPGLRLFGPSGQSIATAYSEYCAELSVALTNIGIYTVVCNDQLNNIGNYAISMVKIPGQHSTNDLDVGTIIFGETLTGTIDKPGDMDVATFTVSAGDTVTVTMVEVDIDINPVIELYNPTGTLVATASDVFQESSVITNWIATNGTYTVVCKDSEDRYNVSDQHNGSYTVTLNLLGGPSMGSVPVAPTNIWATDGDYEDRVVVAWSVVTNADGYAVWRNTSNDTASATNLSVASSTNYDDMSASVGQTYYYWVKATNSVGFSGFGTTNDIGWRGLSAPAGVTASDGTYTNKVQVNWVSVTGATGYTVWRNLSNDTGSASSIGTNASTNYNDTTAEVGTNYFYWAKATNSLDTSGFSTNDTGWRGLPPPAAVVASDGTYTNKVQVNWQSVTGATSYTVWRNTSNETSTATQLGSSVSTNYDDTGAAQDVLYYYWVKSVNPLGSSGFSGSDDGWRGLPPPAGVTASDGTYTNKVAVNWGSVSGALGYTVWRNTSNDTNTATSVGSPASTNYDDTGATSGVLYFYWVKAVNTLDTSGFSEKDTGWRGLPAPSGIMASDGTYTDKVAITWGSVTNATGYQVWRNVSNDTGSATNVGLAANTNYYDDTTAAPGTLYFYWAKATNSVHVSGFSTNDTGWRALLAPLGVMASDGTYTNKVAVNWGSVTGATGYQVWRNVSNDTGSATNVGLAASTNYDDTGAAPGTLYFYWAKATNSLGNSAFSTNDTGWRALTAPAGVTASDGTYSGKVEVTWGSVTNATGYQVWRNLSNDTVSASSIGTSASTNYDDTTASPGMLYFYWAKATNSVGVGGFSTHDTGWRALSPPAAVSAGDGAYVGKVEVTWSSVTNATHYQVWRNLSNDTVSASSIGTSATTNYNDTSGGQGILYYYWAKATNSLGVSGFSTHDTGWRALSAPAGVTVSDGTYTDKVAITWGSVTNAPGYEVWRNTENASGSASNIGSSIITNYNDTTAEPEIVYYYWVKATNTLGISGFSAGDSGWRAFLSPPAAVSASDGTYTNKVNVTWSSVTGSTSYEVWRSESSYSGSASLKDETANTYYDDIAVTAGTTYYYWIKAKNSFGVSGFSNPDSGYVSSGDGDLGLSRVHNDYDGDSKSDLAVYNELTGYWFILLSSSGEIWDEKFGEAGYIPSPGDYDGDGKTDMTVYHEDSGYWYFMLSGSEYSLSYQKLGELGYQPVAGDYDGDGKSDVAVYHESSGYWYIIGSSDWSLSYLKFGEPGYTPVTGDYDGDGKSDLAVYHESSGYWYILGSSDWSLSYLKFGEPGYTPVPGDYDGDGKSDLAVYHESSGYWYILGSSDWSLLSSKFGGSWYTPVTGDYDGDGKVDLTIYLETYGGLSGSWLIQLSSTQDISYQNFGDSGYTPVQ